MKVVLCNNSNEVGLLASKQAKETINQAIKINGCARILLSTGASQFTFFENFIKEDIDWEKVEMFHLDEYVGCSVEHPASFKRYLLERFIHKVNIKNYHLIDGINSPQDTIEKLTNVLSEKQVDLGLIGIGENAHIAFNDPPADFEDKSFYKIVELSDTCRAQQLREGWFKTDEEVFKQAISMTCTKILDCKKIICAVPYIQKAKAIKDTLTNDISIDIPATILKSHDDVTIYVDFDSTSLTDKVVLNKFIKKLEI